MSRMYHAHPTYVARHSREDNVVERGSNVAARIIYLIGGLIITLLAARFLLSLLGANQSSQFVNLIYSFSDPLVRPFIGLFNYNPQFGVIHFETPVLVAIVFYTILMSIVGRLVGLGRRSNTY